MGAKAGEYQKRPRQAGFSMIEMLMTAFILAIGILGLSLLQVMSLRAARGGRSLTTAVLVAEHVMDEAELEGRLSWLNVTDTNLSSPSIGDLKYLKYIIIKDGVELPEYFNIKGGPVNAASTDPAEQSTYFSVFTSRVASTATSLTGAMSDITVRVEFTDQVDQSQAPIKRTISMTRRITHG